MFTLEKINRTAMMMFMEIVAGDNNIVQNMSSCNSFLLRLNEPSFLRLIAKTA